MHKLNFPMPNRPDGAQNGSVFFLILLGIMIFAALSYAIFNGSRSSSANLSRDQAKLAAQEILSYMETVQKTVTTLRLRGCLETQINFSPETSQTNPLAPADKSCNVFDPAGGSVALVKPQLNWLTNQSNNYWWINAQTAVQGIGTTSTELIMWSLTVKPEICSAFNVLSSLRSEGFEEIVGTHSKGFDGTFPLVANGIGDDTGSIFAQKTQGCISHAGSGDIWSVLLAR